MAFRYDQPPVLQSVNAFGSETLVPNNDVCRLSYYLKCCVVGCGIKIGIPDFLLDYASAHRLPVAAQEQILRYSLSNLNLFTLLNRAFILDDDHVLLPQGTLNTFFEIKTASAFFSISSFLVASGQQVQIHKVMLCSLKWMKEYYIEPFVRYHQGNPILHIEATPVMEDEEVSIAVMLDDSPQQGMVVTPIRTQTQHQTHSYADTYREDATTRLLQSLRICCGCLDLIHSDEAPCYRCTECSLVQYHYCQDCFTAGAHDQTHTFERICRTSTETLSPRVQRVQEEDVSLLPSLPVALAVPLREQKVAGKISIPGPVATFPCTAKKENLPTDKGRKNYKSKAHRKRRQHQKSSTTSILIPVHATSSFSSTSSVSSISVSSSSSSLSSRRQRRRARTQTRTRKRRRQCDSIGSCRNQKRKATTSGLVNAR